MADAGPGELGSTAARARRAIDRARTGSCSNSATAAASADGSFGGTSRPVSPSAIMFLMSPVGVDTIGSPEPQASSTEIGWLSMVDALTKTSARL